MTFGAISNQRLTDTTLLVAEIVIKYHLYHLLILSMINVEKSLKSHKTFEWINSALLILQIFWVEM